MENRCYSPNERESFIEKLNLSCLGFLSTLVSHIEYTKARELTVHAQARFLSDFGMSSGTDPKKNLRQRQTKFTPQVAQILI